MAVQLVITVNEAGQLSIQAPPDVIISYGLLLAAAFALHENAKAQSEKKIIPASPLGFLPGGKMPG